MGEKCGGFFQASDRSSMHACMNLRMDKKFMFNQIYSFIVELDGLLRLRYRFHEDFHSELQQFNDNQHNPPLWTKTK